MAGTVSPCRVRNSTPALGSIRLILERVQAFRGRNRGQAGVVQELCWILSASTCTSQLMSTANSVGWNGLQIDKFSSTYHRIF